MNAIEMAENYKKNLNNSNQDKLSKNILNDTRNINDIVNDYKSKLATSVPKTTISGDEYSKLSKKQLLAKQDDILKQLNNYKREEKVKWWDSENNVFENMGNVLYKTFIEDQKTKYKYDAGLEDLKKQYEDINKEIENRSVKEESENLNTFKKIGYTVTGNIETAMKGIESTALKILKQPQENYDLTFDERMAQISREQTSGLGGVGLDVLGSVSRMVPQMATGNTIAANVVGFANYGGSAYNEAKRDGATEEQARKYGITIGSLETSLEKLLGGFENIYGKSAMGKLSNKIISNVVKNPTARKTLSRMAGEFTEEQLQEFLEPIVRNTILEEENGADFWNTMKSDLKAGIKQLGSQLFNTQNLYAGALGALTSATLELPNNIRYSKTNASYNNDPQTSSTDSLLKSNNNTTTNTNNNTINVLNNASNNVDTNLSNQNNYQYLPTANEKVNNLNKIKNISNIQTNNLENNSNVDYNTNEGDSYGRYKNKGNFGESTNNAGRRVGNIQGNYGVENVYSPVGEGSVSQSNKGYNIEQGYGTKEQRQQYLNYANENIDNSQTNEIQELNQIAKDLGVDLKFFKGAEDGMFLGTVYDNAIYIDSNESMEHGNLQNRFYHELLHYLKSNNDNNFSQELKDIIKNYNNNDVQQSIANFVESKGYDSTFLNDKVKRMVFEDVLADYSSKHLSGYNIDYNLPEELVYRLNTALDDAITTMKMNVKNKNNTLKGDVLPKASDIEQNKYKSIKNALNINKETRTESDRLVDKKILNNERTIGELQKAKKEAIENIEKKITEKRELYKSKKNKNTKIANLIQQQAITLENQRVNLENAYDNRIKRLEERNERLSSKEYKSNNQKKNKMQEFRELAENLIIDNIDTWTDKFAGIFYKLDKMERNFKDIIPDKAVATTMNDTYIEPIKLAEAKMKKYINYFNDKIKSLNLSNEESIAVQMLGEGKFNGWNIIEDTKQAKSIIDNKKSDTNIKASATLYLNAIDYIENNNLDINKIEKSINMFHNVYDRIYSDINRVLKELGFKEIEYRKDYFPHFQEEYFSSKIGKAFEKLGWKKINNDLPTDIAGITDLFKPNRAYFKHAQRRYGNITEYNALKGYDQYIRGAANWIYMTEPIMKLRALESEIRYLHSEKGIQEQYDQIINDNSLTSAEKHEKIEEIFKTARNPLNNFVTELRSYTDGLANKKSELDRRLESNFNRTVYSTMTNIENRISSNMVGLNISSALTNFIPITQATSQVKSKYILQAMKDTINNSIKSDGFSENSEFLVNRTMKADRLYKTKLDKISDKANIVFDSIDNFTSNVIVRSKYLQNIDKGMTKAQAMKNANQFANNLMAGRDKASLPTIFNSKNPIVKLYAAFQLEVTNQYGYMLKDLPNDLKGEAANKLISAFIKMFFGAWLGNQVSKLITGRKIFFSPADIVLDSIKTIQNDNMSTYEKLASIASDTAQELPFIGGILGGGRLPISSALPSLSTTVKSTVELFDDDKRSTAFNNLKKELSKPIYYIALPFGGGQLKKTVEGLGMYAHGVPGSYATNGNLRFTAKTDPLSIAQNAIFGQYSSKEAQEYYEQGYSALTEKQQEEFLKLDVSISEYRSYLSHLSKLNKIKADKDENDNAINGTAIAKQAYEMVNNNVEYSEKEMNYLLSKLSSNAEHPTTVDDLSIVDNNLDVYKYYFKLSYDSKQEFLNIVSTTGIDQEKYVSAKNTISETTEKYKKKNENSIYTGDKAKAYSNYLSKQKRKEIFNYINSLNLKKAEKIIMYKKAGYSINDYKNYMYDYVKKLDASKEEKEKLWKYLYGE